MTQKWTQADIPDLTGKVIVITGANSGLGFECAKTFAEKGATVVMTARNLQKGEAARAEILQTWSEATVDLMPLDVGDLRSVRAFAAAFQEQYDRLDILLNNAGVMAIPRQLTPDGFEMQLGVNHLGHFALTGLLLDVITQTPRARIHNVSSSANYTGEINFDDLMGEENYSRWAAYGQSKLANIFFTFELQKRLTAAGFDTMANTSHPGIVIGNLQANSVEQSGTGIEAMLYRIAQPLVAQDITMGVLPMLYGMTAPAAKGGVFYGPRTFNLRGYPAEKKANKAAYDAAALKRFWDVSEELTGVHFLNLHLQKPRFSV
jgi:NAD(P)-dependent dehydrogenase (short-subunit alcohol dehydrogenase family)